MYYDGTFVYLHWPSCTVSQGTDSVSLDLLTELPNHVNLCCPCITFHKTPHHLIHPVHPCRKRQIFISFKRPLKVCTVKVSKVNQTEAALTFSAGCALATALMFVELNEAGNGSDDVSL